VAQLRKLSLPPISLIDLDISPPWVIYSLIILLGGHKPPRIVTLVFVHGYSTE